MSPTNVNSHYQTAIIHFAEVEASLREIEIDLESMGYSRTAAEVESIRDSVAASHYRFNVQFGRGRRLPERKAVS